MHWGLHKPLARFVALTMAGCFSAMGAFCMAGSSKTALRSTQVELPNQEHNVIKTSWPAIGCWFWTREEFQPEGYKPFIDLYEKHSPFRLLTTSIRHPVEVTDPNVHDQIKAAAEYARAHGMAIVMDLDVRLARQAFMDKHPGEMQEVVRLREVALAGSGEADLAIKPINLGDHYTFRARGYESLSARVLRVYSYVRDAKGIEPDTVRDITRRCKVQQADARGVRVTIPCTVGDQGRTACVLTAFTLFTPDVFAPHLASFERGILQQYADVPLAGACKDEWGFPGQFQPSTSDLYFSRFMAEAYARRRPGRDLVRDLLLISKGERGPEGPRVAAVNHYMEMIWRRNGQVETEYYKAIKDVFGPQAMSATHPTWFPYPGKREIFKNGLSWWACTRDLAQTDEGTPYCVRTALAKKWRSPLWYNMYYGKSLKDYDLWSHTLGGGRINYHPRWPMPWNSLKTNLLEGDLLRAESRVQLLNYISTGPIDCPVAVVFGHPAATNWAGGKGFGDVGMALSDALWKDGYYADLIPSSEITSGALHVGPSGRIQYGSQQYQAAVFYHPQYERRSVADLFCEAATQGKTLLYRVGEWTSDFDGKSFDGNAALPGGMKALAASDCARTIIARLKADGVLPQTACSPQRRSHTTIMVPNPSGRCRLIDGTVILASGERDVMGDPVKRTIMVGGRSVRFDAVGVAAVRLDENGKVDAVAAGALKSFETDSLTIDLPVRIDLALFREGGEWRGIVQGHEGDLPTALTELTGHWTRLRMPERRRTAASPRSAKSSETGDN
ncbi:hypothetical protein HQ560_03970 [bacterium]|nr:hypothetical protein [bacterium]